MVKNTRTISGIAMVAALTLSACATKPQHIEASYVSPAMYNSYSCAQLTEEAQRVSAKAAAANGVQAKKAKQDAVATGIAIVVFWPAAFFVKGDGATSAEVAQLKGQMKALEEASIAKKCGISFKSAA